MTKPKLHFKQICLLGIIIKSYKQIRLILKTVHDQARFSFSKIICSSSSFVHLYLLLYLLCRNVIVWFQKISILPPQKGLEIPGRRGPGVSKTQKFKAMYEAKLEFPEGWGGHRANPFRGGGGGGDGYFLEPHIVPEVTVLLVIFIFQSRCWPLSCIYIRLKSVTKFL